MTNNPLTDLHQFTGTEQWFRHALNRKVLYTEGAQYVAEKAGAYWLLDEIALAQGHVPQVKATPFQVWNLTVKPDHSATLVCEDGNGNTVYSKEIPFTDFPAQGIRFFFTDNVLLLPSEY
jgi:hypothetical protein